MTPALIRLIRADLRPSHRGRPRASRGQAIVEFALVAPIMILIVAGIADLGRVYSSGLAIESAAREAADFGAFSGTYWAPINRDDTVAKMQKRACTAAANLDGYAEPSGTVDHSTCTNPTFAYTLEPDSPSCSDPATDPPCIVHVSVGYDFHLFLGIPPMPSTIHLVRESRFQISDLTPP